MPRSSRGRGAPSPAALAQRGEQGWGQGACAGSVPTAQQPGAAASCGVGRLSPARTMAGETGVHPEDRGETGSLTLGCQTPGEWTGQGRQGNSLQCSSFTLPTAVLTPCTARTLSLPTWGSPGSCQTASSKSSAKPVAASQRAAHPAPRFPFHQPQGTFPANCFGSRTLTQNK